MTQSLSLVGPRRRANLSVCALSPFKAAAVRTNIITKTFSKLPLTQTENTQIMSFGRFDEHTHARTHTILNGVAFGQFHFQPLCDRDAANAHADYTPQNHVAACHWLTNFHKLSHNCIREVYKISTLYFQSQKYNGINFIKHAYKFKNKLLIKIFVPLKHNILTV